GSFSKQGVPRKDVSAAIPVERGSAKKAPQPLTKEVKALGGIKINLTKREVVVPEEDFERY
ncbi:MAG TPA: hypothetical protein VLL73_03035, partial [Desulfurivibrionaceae bacterium]|nr:hypothetical protein [Desulfurivibrionaceae bacterium]